MRKVEESDDGGGSGRTGRVRKKSAKVLEMEEFEQAEKSSSSTKKSKTPKVPNVIPFDNDVPDVVVPSKKSKAAISGVVVSSEATPTSRKSKKMIEPASSLPGARSIPAELTRRTSSTMMIAPVASVPQVQIERDIKQEVPPPSSVLSSVPSTSPVISQEIKQENPKSVIKYLLTSPSSGTPNPISTPSVGVVTAPSGETRVPAKPKKSSKKIKFEDGTSAPPPKKKEKKMKIEIMSPSEIKPPVASIQPPESKAPSLKMKIVSGSNPMTAQVAMEMQDIEPSPAPKVKKSKKIKKEAVEDIKLEIASTSSAGDSEKVVKKKKVLKKKEKLIQNAINAAKQIPSMPAVVSTPQGQAMVASSPSPTPAKPSKKKIKKESSSSATIKTELNTSDSLVMDFDDNGMEDEGEESTLVIAETEKKKKKVSTKKKSPKEKDGSETSKQQGEKTKKIPKRAPTAYMLFCNSHRPAIVAENPGIEFAGISRKLGELWQTQSNKQKLQWRRKAQRRMKKSNLISTGKVGGKESQGGPLTSTPVPVAPPAPLSSTNKKLALMLQKSKPVMVVDEGPLSPTKVGIDPNTMVEHDENDDSYNFSIEPLDVAAHLKLLGESLSIIGMRLQEHKGMIAVQGSLSVLLDSLLCACGPLLCLTQQVPGMDGCSPLVHAQTLDSVAYVMPGL